MNEPARQYGLFGPQEELFASTVGKSVRKGPVFLVLLLTIGIAAGFGYRLYGLQVTDAERFASIASHNRLRTEIVPARRGIIYDRNGKVLADNVLQYSLTYDPSLGPWPEGQSFPSEWGTIRKPREISPLWPTVVARVPDEFALKYVTNPTLPPQFSVVSDARRSYPYGNSFSSVLGYLGRLNQTQWEKLAADNPEDFREHYRPNDWRGQAGIEASYESVLRGTAKIIDHIVDAKGQEVAVRERKASQDGPSLALSVNADWQRAAVDAYVAVTGGTTGKERPGSVVVSDPNTGEIFALASFPTYDPDAVATPAVLANKNSPLLNRPVAGLYPSGSVIKPYYALVALHEGVVNGMTKVLSTGGIQLGNRFFPDWKAGGHGVVDVRSAIAWSVNTFFYAIGGGYGPIKGMGIDMMDRYLSFFFNAKTGIDLPGERAGFVPTPAWKEEDKKVRWFVGDTYNVSIGQGDLLVTPLQINMMTNFIASKGKLYRPHFTKDAKPESVLSADFPDISPEAFAIVGEGMRGAVTYGSARALDAAPFAVYGKTGTAQWSSRNKTHAWFTGYAASREKPEVPLFSITVMVESGGEGSAVAVPVAARFLQAIGKP